MTGTFNVCGRVLDANRYLTKQFCDVTQTLTIIIDTKKWGFRLKKEAGFSYTINVNDSIDVLTLTSTDFGTSYTLRLNYDTNMIYWYPTSSPPSSAPTQNIQLQYTAKGTTVDIEGVADNFNDTIPQTYVTLNINGKGILDYKSNNTIQVSSGESYKMPDGRIILEMTVTNIEADLTNNNTKGNIYLFCTFSAPSS